MQTRGMWGITRQQMNSSPYYSRVSWQWQGRGPARFLLTRQLRFNGTRNCVCRGLCVCVLLLRVTSLPQLDFNTATRRRWNGWTRPPALFYLGRHSVPVQSSSCTCIKFCKQCHAPSWRSRSCVFYSAALLHLKAGTDSAEYTQGLSKGQAWYKV